MNTNRGDMPAMPQSVAQSMDGGTITSADFAECQGMTIREQMAMAAMQGILSSAGNVNRLGLTNGQVVNHSVDIADLLLEKLEKTK